MASELKPCPFCGGKATFAAAMSDEEGVEILCCNKDCTLLCVSTYATEDEAIAAWNTRTDPQRNRLVKTLKKIRDNPEQHFTYYNRPEEGHSCYFRKGRAKAFQEIAELARDVLEEERRIEAAKKGSHD